MNWFDAVLSSIGAVLLPISMLLLLEELTYGGLVRLLLAPRPDTGKHTSPKSQGGGGK